MEGYGQLWPFCPNFCPNKSDNLLNMALIRTKWDSALRKLIKNECSKGWLVEEQSKKTKLVRRNDDGKQAVTLPIPYEPLEQTTILNAVVGIRKLMLKDKTLNLKQAAEIYLDNNDMSIKPKTKVVGTWETIRRDFEKAREGLAKSTRNETARRLTRLLGVIDGKKIVSKLSHYDKKLKRNIYADTIIETFQKPTNGDQLIRKYAEKFFPDMPAGGDGRSRDLDTIASFIEYAVEERKLMPDKWLYNFKRIKKELLGGASTTEMVAISDIDDTLEVSEFKKPIKPEQLSMLLDAMQADQKHDLYFVTALIGLYGLRLAEIAVLTVRDGEFLCGNFIKRNRNTKKNSKPPFRKIMGLDLPDKIGLASEIKTKFESRLFKFPLPIRTQISKVKEKGTYKDIGQAYYQLLDRYQPWKDLLATPDGKGLSPYSLRHGWAWRAHKMVEPAMHYREAAGLMGHTPQTHLSHYGSYFDKATQDDALAKYNEGLKKLQEEMSL